MNEGISRKESGKRVRREIKLDRALAGYRVAKYSNALSELSRQCNDVTKEVCCVRDSNARCSTARGTETAPSPPLYQEVIHDSLQTPSDILSLYLSWSSVRDVGSLLSARDVSSSTKSSRVLELPVRNRVANLTFDTCR